MRTIEEQMIQAIKEVRNWQSRNTSVKVTEGSVKVFLHNNLIAEKVWNVGEWEFTLAGWNTRTTRSRLQVLINTFCSPSSGVRLYNEGEETEIDSRSWFSFMIAGARRG